ncbi:MAG TPA: glycosyltransferase, partial [Methylotenera sp.]|nr:glycosyltransferase [Methylotenera sp.]
MSSVVNRKLTVVQVLPALQSGGVERGTLEVGKYLVEQGHRSIVISDNGRLVNQLIEEGSEHIHWPIGRKSLLTLRFIPHLIAFLKDNEVDVLHVRSRFPAWICYLAWKIMPVSKRPHLITTVHGTYSISPYSAIMTKGEQVIVISKMIRDYVLKNYRVNPDKLHLNYRGVDEQSFPYAYQPTKEWLEK